MLAAQLYNLAHKLATKIPLTLVVFWLFCAFFNYDPKANEVYRILLLFIFFHFAKFTQKYTVFEKQYVYCIFSIVFTNAFTHLIGVIDYLTIYYFINLFFIIFSIWTITTTPKKKN